MGGWWLHLVLFSPSLHTRLHTNQYPLCVNIIGVSLRTRVLAFETNQKNAFTPEHTAQRPKGGERGQCVLARTGVIKEGEEKARDNERKLGKAKSTRFYYLPIEKIIVINQSNH
jgi:hypothetical protein